MLSVVCSMFRCIGIAVSYCFGTDFASSVASFVGMGLTNAKKGKSMVQQLFRVAHEVAKRPSLWRMLGESIIIATGPEVVKRVSDYIARNANHGRSNCNHGKARNRRRQRG